jgi:hypothetical protein
MTINFFLNWNEYHDAREFFRSSRGDIAPEKVTGGVLLVASALWFFLDNLNLLAVVGFAAGLIAIFAFPIFRRWEAKHKWEREPLYHTEHAVSFDESGVHFRMGGVESNLDWGYYQRMVESPDGFLLVYSNDSFNYLPKHAFDGEPAIDEFRSLASKNLKEKPDSSINN